MIRNKKLEKFHLLKKVNITNKKFYTLSIAKELPNLNLEVKIICIPSKPLIKKKLKNYYNQFQAVKIFKSSSLKGRHQIQKIS